MNFDLAKIIRRLVPIILIGIVGNTLFMLFTSDDNSLDNLGKFSLGFFSLALCISLLPWLGHAIRTVIWSRFLNFPITFKDSFRIALAHDLGGGNYTNRSGRHTHQIWPISFKRHSYRISGNDHSLTNTGRPCFFNILPPVIYLFRWRLGRSCN